MLIAVEDIHKKGVVHLDIKPSNFVMCKGDDIIKVKLIDYGMSKIYKKDNGNHIKQKDRCEFRGTVYYASLNSHNKQV
jgi:serine/threonine protein kinase